MISAEPKVEVGYKSIFESPIASKRESFATQRFGEESIDEGENVDDSPPVKLINPSLNISVSSKRKSRHSSMLEEVKEHPAEGLKLQQRKRKKAML